MLRQARYPWTILQEQLGPANLFNPIRPEGDYALDLRSADARVVAQQLVLLSSEPGENLDKTSYNGMPFDVGAKWMVSVPDVGMFCITFVTPPGCASLRLRLALARRTLMPGHGRWRAIPIAYRDPDDDPWQCEASLGCEWMTIGADGGLIDDTRQQEYKPTASVLLYATLFQSKLRRALATIRLKQMTTSIRKIDQLKASNLPAVVTMALKFLRETSSPQSRQRSSERGTGRTGDAIDGSTATVASDTSGAVDGNLSGWRRFKNPEMMGKLTKLVEGEEVA